MNKRLLILVGVILASFSMVWVIEQATVIMDTPDAGVTLSMDVNNKRSKEFTTIISPTITPNIPVEITALATAIPPKGVGGRPDVQIAALAFNNKTKYALDVAIHTNILYMPIITNQDGLASRRSNAASTLLRNPDKVLSQNDISGQPNQKKAKNALDTDVPPHNRVERRLVPGIYGYSLKIQGSDWPGQSEIIQLDNRTLIEIIISEGTVAFVNNTDLAMEIVLLETSIRYSVPPHSTSQTEVVAPGLYTYQATPVGGRPITGQVRVEFGSATTITLSAEMLVAALAIENRTIFEAVVTLEGEQVITIAPSSTSAEIELAPGTYNYTVRFSGGNVGPLRGSVTLEPGYIQTLVLELDLDQAEVNIINNTECELTIDLSGPQSFLINVAARQSKEINILSGNYHYTVQACGASLSGSKSFSGKSDWIFSFGTHRLEVIHETY